MSRVGQKPLEIPEGVEVKIEEKGRLGGQKIIVHGPLGELVLHFRKQIVCEKKDNVLTFKRINDTKMAKSLHGLYRTIIQNNILGVTKGYEKKLELEGIGYRAEVKGDVLVMLAGASHPYEVKAPEGIEFLVDDKVNITIKGIDKQQVGEVASNIRALSKPEPYKGKGIHYKGEYIRRKPGKVAKSLEEGSAE